MVKKLLILILIATFISPATLFAKSQKSNSNTDQSSAATNAAEDEVIKDEENELRYEKKAASADRMVMWGTIIGAVGGAGAIAGSIYLTAKPSKKVTGAIIAGSGAFVALVGGVITMWGYHKRSGLEGAYLAPVVDPAKGAYGMGVGFNF